MWIDMFFETLWKAPGWRSGRARRGRLRTSVLMGKCRCIGTVGEYRARLGRRRGDRRAQRRRTGWRAVWRDMTIPFAQARAATAPPAAAARGSAKREDKESLAFASRTALRRLACCEGRQGSAGIAARGGGCRLTTREPDFSDRLARHRGVLRQTRRQHQCGLRLWWKDYSGLWCGRKAAVGGGWGGVTASGRGCQGGSTAG
jgi:hypothetical protein